MEVGEKTYFPLWKTGVTVPYFVRSNSGRPNNAEIESGLSSCRRSFGVSRVGLGQIRVRAWRQRIEIGHFPLMTPNTPIGKLCGLADVRVANSLP
jgi:hypothetical protein